MAQQLMVVENDSLSGKDLDVINRNIDKLINGNINNDSNINQLAFLCSGILASGDDFYTKVADKLRSSMLWGNIYDRNRELQDKLVNNKESAQYVAQLVLQKLAEKRLMSFDVITAINNRLNASANKIDVEFQKIHKGMASFLKQNKGELTKLEARLDKAERNINLLTWQTSIEYQDFDGVEYCDLDEEAQIVCLVRDFYEITKGKWTTSDLLVLKSAMSDIDLHYKSKVNFFEAIQAIASQDALKNKLLGGKHIAAIVEPEMLLSMSNVKKLDDFAGEDHYLVESVEELLSDNGISMDEPEIVSELTKKYFRKEINVNMDIEVDVYDLCLDLLYNLKQAETMGILVGDKALTSEKGPDVPYKDDDGDADEHGEIDDGENIPEILPADKQPGAEFVAKGDEYYEGKVRSRDYEQAIILYQKAADMNNIVALNKLAEMFVEGKGRKAPAPAQARNLWIKAGQLGDASGYFRAAKSYAEFGNREKTLEQYTNAMNSGNLGACHEIAKVCMGITKIGRTVKKDIEMAERALLRAVELGDKNAYGLLGRLWIDYAPMQNIRKAYKYWENGVQAGDGECAYFLGEVSYYAKDYEEAFRYFEKAEKLGYESYNLFDALATMYEKGQSVYIDKKKAMEYFQKKVQQSYIDKRPKSEEDLLRIALNAQGNHALLVNVSRGLIQLANNEEPVAKLICKASSYNDLRVRDDFLIYIANYFKSSLQNNVGITVAGIATAIRKYDCR